MVCVETVQGCADFVITSSHAKHINGEFARNGIKTFFEIKAQASSVFLLPESFFNIDTCLISKDVCCWFVFDTKCCLESNGVAKPLPIDCDEWRTTGDK